VTEQSNTDVLLETDGAIATIRFNRPARRNALSPDLLRGFRELLGQVAASDARVLIITGAGKDFCVGADMQAAVSKAEGGPPGLGGWTYEELARIYESGRILHEAPQVTIAAIDGGCAGPGLAWAGACDLRFASDRAVFNTAFLNVGVAGEMGLAWSLTRVVGGAWAREWLLFPEKVRAEEAHRLGLVTRLFPAERLQAETMAAAAQLAARAPAALRTAKANILSAEKLDLAQFIELEGARHAHLAGDKARMEGFKAFLEKRPPEFS
jgi:2-(1,2-epoxy-1,2-dihydrophenyl)acetyl-CoA isomerase